MIASIATWCCTLQLNMFLKISEWDKLSGCFPGPKLLGDV